MYNIVRLHYIYLSELAMDLLVLLKYPLSSLNFFHFEEMRMRTAMIPEERLQDKLMYNGE